MGFTQDYCLENQRVLLRPLQEQDLEHLLPFVLQEPQIWQYSLACPTREQDLRDYIKSALIRRKDEQQYLFIVFDKKTQSYAGSTRLHEFNFSHQSINIGFTWYGQNFQGTGLNKNAKFLLLEFVFEKLRMQRVEFRADSLNQRSIAALKCSPQKHRLPS